MKTFYLLFYDFCCQKKYRKDIRVICEWLDIPTPNRLIFFPDKIKRRNCRGEYHFKSGIILIFVPDFLFRTHSEFVVETIAHELIHCYQNSLGIDMSETEIVEKSAEALTNSFMEDLRNQHVARGAVREYISQTAGGR